LLNANHQHMSDGTVMSPHKPLLLARAGSCSGTCPTSNSDIAGFLFADQSSTVAADSLADAVTGGGAWDLSGSNIPLGKGSASGPDLPSLSFVDTRGTVGGQPKIIPTTSSERGDYTWLADMAQVCPSCTLDSSIVSASVPNDVVVAKIHLHSGSVFTYSIARVGSDVTPVHFQRVDEASGPSSYTQAVATWMAADVSVSADSIKIVDDSGTGRSMTLSPDTNGKVEVAVINLPPFVPPTTANDGTPEVGKHF